jgi:TPR repeat protein
MHNTALCFLGGDGLLKDFREAKRWMKRAALAGHRKAQAEHGLMLFAEGAGGLALVFLESATRAGETSGTHIRDSLLQQLTPKARAHAITCADHWTIKQPSRS